MRVLVPFVDGGLCGETVLAVAAATARAPVTEIRFELLAGDDGYWRLLSEAWHTGGDLAIVEQDIVPHPGALAELDRCGSPWCTFGYQYDRVGVYHGSGCVRFRGELAAAVPDLWDRVAKRSNRLHPPRHWCTLDAFAQHELAVAGFRQCKHSPPVGHVHTGCSHGCLGQH